MKKILAYMMSALLLIACGGGDDGDGNTPTGGSEYLNVQNVDIPGGNTTATLYISASPNCDWKVSWNESWIRSISPRTGRGTQNATITVTQNPSSTTAREAVITVENANGTIVRNVTVVQSASAEATDFHVSTSELEAKAVAGTVQFYITGNARWTLTSNQSWATPNSTSGEGNATIIVTLTDNTSEQAREAVITVTSDSKSETVTIHQNAAAIPGGGDNVTPGI